MNNYEEVSKELAMELDNTTNLNKDKEKIMEEIQEEVKSYQECTWYGNCYYCKDAMGRWRVVRCIS